MANNRKSKSQRAKEKKDTNRFIKEPIDLKKIDTQSVLNENYPIFCFKYLSDKSINGCSDPKFYFDFLMRLKKLSELGWNEIRTSTPHSFGMEPIPKKDIKPRLPSCITPEVKDLHVLRANGSNLPFIGLQIQDIFRVLFIETKFGDIYNH
ncbi:hypothetical protein FACS1894162_8970 [Bacteroidia bacterium]|nr:hypothetical protein FACS1894162_8970 [Bacteroidia bacterium]